MTTTITLPTSQQSLDILSRLPLPQLPVGTLKILSRNADKRLIWYDTTNKIVYAVDSTVAAADRKILYASYDYCLTWIEVYTMTGNNYIGFIYTLASGYHLIRNGYTGKIGRLPADFSSITYSASVGTYQPLNSAATGIVEYDGIILLAEYSVEGVTCYIKKSYDDGITWYVSLDGTGLRHFHGVQVDPYTGYFWAYSGDSDAACKIFKCEAITADANPDTWVEMTGGTQADRTCGLAFTKDYVYWAMDSTSSPKVYKADKATFTPAEVLAVPGDSCVLGAAMMVDMSIVFWTRIEETSSQQNYASFFILADDAVVLEQKFICEPSSGATFSQGFTRGSFVDDNNVWFVEGVQVTMDGLIGFVLPMGL